MVFLNKYEVPVTEIKVDKGVTEITAAKFDHFPITFFAEHDFNTSKIEYTNRTVRNINAIDINSLNEKCESLLQDYFTDNVHLNNFENAVNVFNMCLDKVLDKFAPPTVKRYQRNPKHLPLKWMDEEYRAARNIRRRFERAYRAQPNVENKSLFLNQVNLCASMAKQKMASGISSMIKEREKSGDLFEVLNSLLDNENEHVIPEGDNFSKLANDFNSYYISKIENIRAAIPHSTKPFVFETVDIPVFHEFQSASNKDILTIIQDMGRIKTSPIDPFPAKLLSKCIDMLLPTIVTIINKSLNEGTVVGLKHSVIIPKYKDKKLDKNEKKSFRPIFNIPILGKLIEKVVLKQFSEHISHTPYDSPYQHGYKKFHSTETMLLEMYDEVLLGFDKNFCTVLVMIDMSAAFDTVDIDILLDILKNQLNITGTAFLWFQSFLKDRTQCVKIGNCYSNSAKSKFGVPPGSTLGPILFNVYSKGLSDVMINSGFKTGSYADDSNGRLQFIINMQYSSMCVNIPYLLDNIQQYMNKFYLKMNCDKTEIMLLHPKCLSGKTIQGFFLNRDCVRFTKECKYLGFFIDPIFSFDKQVNGVISICNLKLRKIRKLRHLMDRNDAETCVRSVIFSKINYCNILFLNLSCANLDKLQKLQNTAVRLIFNLPPRSSVSDKYDKLKLLRVNQLIVLKCLLFVHKFFVNKLPESIKNLINVQNETNRLLVVKYYGSSHATRSFSYCAPRYWNKLPLSVRLTDCTSTFKTLTKTILLENQNNILGATTGYYFLPR